MQKSRRRLREVEVVRLSPEESAARAKRRSQDIWPDPASVPAEEALAGLQIWTDPFMISLFKSHHNATVRRVAERRWREVLKRAA